MAATDNLNSEQQFVDTFSGSPEAMKKPLRQSGMKPSTPNPPAANGSRPLGTGPAQPPNTGRFDNRPAAKEERKTNRQAKWEAKHPE
jgi:hypothetical protein